MNREKEVTTTVRDEPTRSHAARILLVYGLIWVATAIAPRHFLTWLLENIPVLVFIVALAVTWKRFAFSNLSYALIAVFLALHAVGAQTGYAHAPIGFFLRDLFGLDRNFYDRIVHCAAGVLFYYPIRELLLRRSRVSVRAAGVYAVGTVMLGSALFECLEAFIAETFAPGKGPSWLGAQGDEWDAQMDMLMALAGSLAAMAATWAWERSLAEKPGPRPAQPAPGPMPFLKRPWLHALLVVYAAAWAICAIGPVSRQDWLLENLLVVLVLLFFAFSYRRRPLSNISYTLLLAFMLLHAVGAHYTYSKVPLGFWLQDAFQFSRNHFDRIVHFSFGLFLAVPLGDLLRTKRQPRFWAVALPVIAVGAWSGTYEIVEAVVAWTVSPGLGQAYLGTQGDIWDGQKDMAFAIGGAVLASVAWLLIARRDRTA